MLRDGESIERRKMDLLDCRPVNIGLVRRSKGVRRMLCVHPLDPLPIVLAGPSSSTAEQPMCSLDSLLAWGSFKSSGNTIPAFMDMMKVRQW